MFANSAIVVFGTSNSTYLLALGPHFEDLEDVVDSGSTDDLEADLEADLHGSRSKVSK